MSVPTYITAVALDGQPMLRIYRAGELEIAVPLSNRRALLLGSDLVALAAQDLLRADALMLEPPDQQRVANRSEGYTHE
jgi:hypothetical protein